jgi:hypothetical protein
LNCNWIRFRGPVSLPVLSRIAAEQPPVSEWLADALARLSDHPAKRSADLLPWNWKHMRPDRAAA